MDHTTPVASLELDLEQPGRLVGVPYTHDEVRAVLSERYRRLDNFDLAESVLPVLQQLPEVRFESVELTETRMYLKCVTPRLEYEMAPGDVVQAGVVISNSSSQKAGGYQQSGATEN